LPLATEILVEGHFGDYTRARSEGEGPAHSDSVTHTDPANPESVVCLQVRGVSARKGRGILFQDDARHSDSGVVAGLVVVLDDTALGGHGAACRSVKREAVDRGGAVGSQGLQAAEVTGSGGIGAYGIEASSGNDGSVHGTQGVVKIGFSSDAAAEVSNFSSAIGCEAAGDRSADAARALCKERILPAEARFVPGGAAGATADSRTDDVEGVVVKSQAVDGTGITGIDVGRVGGSRRYGCRGRVHRAGAGLIGKSAAGRRARAVGVGQTPGDAAVGGIVVHDGVEGDGSTACLDCFDLVRDGHSKCHHREAVAVGLRRIADRGGDQDGRVEGRSVVATRRRVGHGGGGISTQGPAADGARGAVRFVEGPGHTLAGGVVVHCGVKRDRSRARHHAGDLVRDGHRNRRSGDGEAVAVGL
jgi:hypothetical protein